MAVAVTAVLVALLVAAAIATRPVLRPPLSGIAFTIGFPACELAGQLLVLTAAASGLLVASGWPSGPLGAVDGVVAVLAALAYARLLVTGVRARGAVAEGLRATTGPGGAPRIGRGRNSWLRWWRTWLAVPFGHRGVVVHRDLRYVDDGLGAHRLDVYAPARPARPAPVLVFIHGGAWVFGSKRRQGLPMLHELAARGWVCVTCNYRLSPHATWPDHLVDVRRAIAWTRRHAAEFGGDPAGFLALSGASAGGHLAALAALAWDDPAWPCEGADAPVDACVALYGVLETTGDRELAGRQGAVVAALLEHAVMKVPLASAREVYEAASPLHRVRADAPAFLVLHGIEDSLVPVGVARAFVDALRRVSREAVGYVELPGAQHAFDLLCSPRCTATTEGIAAFLDATVARKAEGARGTPTPAPPPPAGR